MKNYTNIAASATSSLIPTNHLLINNKKLNTTEAETATATAANIRRRNQFSLSQKCAAFNQAALSTSTHFLRPNYQDNELRFTINVSLKSILRLNPFLND